jgi:hypothetical protein
MPDDIVNVTAIPLPTHLDDNDRQTYELLVRSAAAVVAAGIAVGQVLKLVRGGSRDKTAD